MTSPRRIALSLAAVVAASLLMAGCAATPGSTAPVSTGAPSETPGSTDNADLDGDDRELEATWLDDGRILAVVTWGSSSCVPMVEDITAEGQNIFVTLNDGTGDKACTADMAPRASIADVPEGIDPTKDVNINVTYGEVAAEVDLDGNSALTGKPGTATEYAPSAGWIDDGSLVLLTWGSSTCTPIVDKVEGSGSAGTITFAEQTGPCTMDMAPRGTLIGFGDDVVDDDDNFVLTLVGDNLDGDIRVIG